MIQMFWSQWVDQSFYRCICKVENFMYLNGKSVLYLCVAEIVWNYIEDDEEKFNKMREKFIGNRKTFSFVYSYFYPEIYSFVDKRNIDLRNEFHIKFKEWKVKLVSQKTMNNLKWLRQHLHHHHQVQYKKNPTKWIWFWEWMKNCWKTKTVIKKRARKRERRKEIASKNKELRRMKKAEKDKLEEKEPLCRLQELNSDFAKIKKKTQKKGKKKQ